MCRTTLQPQQTIVLDAGNLGVAKTQDQADAFDYLTHGSIVVPVGEYRMNLTLDSRLSPTHGRRSGENACTVGR